MHIWRRRKKYIRRKIDTIRAYVAVLYRICAYMCKFWRNLAGGWNLHCNGSNGNFAKSSIFFAQTFTQPTSSSSTTTTETIPWPDAYLRRKKNAVYCREMPRFATKKQFMGLCIPFSFFIPSPRKDHSTFLSYSTCWDPPQIIGQSMFLFSLLSFRHSPRHDLVQLDHLLLQGLQAEERRIGHLDKKYTKNAAFSRIQFQKKPFLLLCFYGEFGFCNFEIWQSLFFGGKFWNTEKTLKNVSQEKHRTVRYCRKKSLEKYKKILSHPDPVEIHEYGPLPPPPPPPGVRALWHHLLEGPENFEN